MPADKDRNEPKPNPILAAALSVLMCVAPRALTDPEQALRDLVPRLRFLVVAKLEKPTIAQLEALRAFDKASSLVQIRKAIQAHDLCFGPFPGELAERGLMPELARHGLSASLRELTAEERATQLESVDNPPPYFRGSDEQV